MNEVISAPGDSSNQNITISFHGQQWDEPVLHVMRPHWTMIVIRLLQIVILSCLSLFAWWRINHYWPELLSEYKLFGYLAILIIAFIFSWWQLKYYRRLRAYITDRRIVRFTATFPITETRHAIFWREVAKTRDVTSNFVWRAFKIGTVEISTHLTEGGSEISFPYVYYFEDLVSYLDKIIHYSKDSPDQIATVKPFVAKPRAIRYKENGEKRNIVKLKK